jgi:hypothetical protein
MDGIQRVKNMVRHSLVVSPKVTNRELFARAQEIAPQAVEGLSLRQFHARFRLPVLLNEMGVKRARRARSEPRAEGEVAARPLAIARPSAKARKAVRPRRRADGSPAPGAEAAVREILVEFAVQLEGAQSRGDLVRVMGGVNDVVARILNVVQPPRSQAAVEQPAAAPAPASPSGNAAAPSGNGNSPA